MPSTEATTDMATNMSDTKQLYDTVTNSFIKKILLLLMELLLEEAMELFVEKQQKKDGQKMWEAHHKIFVVSR